MFDFDLKCNRLDTVGGCHILEEWKFKQSEKHGLNTIASFEGRVPIFTYKMLSLQLCQRIE